MSDLFDLEIVAVLLQIQKPILIDESYNFFITILKTILNITSYEYWLKNKDWKLYQK